MKTLSNVDIRQVRGHWECIINGEFFCSGDTFEEIIEELRASNETNRAES